MTARTGGSSAFRKAAAGLWRTGADASIFGRVDLDLQDYIDREPDRATRSPLPLVLFLLHQAMRDVAEVHRSLIWGFYWRKREWSFVVPVDSEEHGDLRFVRIAPGPEWTVTEFEKALAGNNRDLRARGSHQMGWSLRLFESLPAWLSPWIFRFLEFLLHELSVSPRLFGFRGDPFGPLVVTNFGSLGLQSGFAPLIPICRNVVTVGVGAWGPMPVVRDDRVIPRFCLPLFFTIDHRALDGSHCARILRRLTAAARLL